MTITKTAVGDGLILALEGRLDTNTAPELEAELHASLPGVARLTLDLAKLEYLSSAGQRLVLFAQKQMNKQGRMTVRNVNNTVMEAFQITGFTDILSFE